MHPNDLIIVCRRPQMLFQHRMFSCRAADSYCFNACVQLNHILTLNYSLSHSLSLSPFLSDMDPLSVTPTIPVVAKLGDMVELQCKTKASAPHTVQWKKVCASHRPPLYCAKESSFPFFICAWNADWMLGDLLPSGLELV